MGDGVVKPKTQWEQLELHVNIQTPSVLMLYTLTLLIL